MHCERFTTNPPTSQHEKSCMFAARTSDHESADAQEVCACFLLLFGILLLLITLLT